MKTDLTSGLALWEKKAMLNVTYILLTDWTRKKCIFQPGTTVLISIRYIVDRQETSPIPPPSQHGYSSFLKSTCLSLTKVTLSCKIREAWREMASSSLHFLLPLFIIRGGGGGFLSGSLFLAFIREHCSSSVFTFYFHSMPANEASVEMSTGLSNST